MPVVTNWQSSEAALLQINTDCNHAQATKTWPQPYQEPFIQVSRMGKQGAFQGDVGALWHVHVS